MPENKKVEQKPKKSEAGKGDCPRPLGISNEEWNLRFDLIYSKNKKKILRKLRKFERQNGK